MEQSITNNRKNNKISTSSLMRKNLFLLIAGVALAIGTTSVQAQSATVASVPEGMITFSLAGNSINYLSLPLSNNVSYTSTVSAVTANTIAVGDSPAPFTMNLSATTAPYFVKFLSGKEIGRILLIKANTAGALTLDVTDNSPQTVNLTTAGFTVAAGDTFEIFPGNTLSTVFGNNTSANPVVLSATSNIFTSDSVSVYSSVLGRFISYFFNASAGQWEQSGSTANANNVILYPYQTVAVTRRLNEAAITLTMSGRVAEVPVLTKTTGNSAITYGSSGFAANLTLSQLQLGATWTKGTNAILADTLSVWNAPLSRFDSYYQQPNLTWRKTTDANNDASSYVLAAGTTVAYVQRASESGASTFLASALPYSLN
jgi:uncharacterized protein (TIGR02597 family)